MALSILKVSKELVAERDYSGAAAGFDKVVRALELLQFFSEEHYQPPLYANSYVLSRIFAFGLNNKSSALTYAEKACEYAGKRAPYNDMAARDLLVMRDFRDALASSQPLTSISEEFGYEFPYDILEMK